ncbi:hypothetical protein, partial [Escherichia coli]
MAPLEIRHRSVRPISAKHAQASRFLQQSQLKLIRFTGESGTVAKLAMRQPFVLFKGLTFQKLCLPGAFRPG